MADETQGDDSQRRFYRIDDEVLFEYKVLGKDGQKASQTADPEKLASELLDHLKQLDETHARLLHQITLSHPSLAEYFRFTHKKMDTIADFIANDLIGQVLQGSSNSKIPQTINLSAGGIGFTRDQPLDNDTLLELRITLLPNTKPFSPKVKSSPAAPKTTAIALV